MKHILLLTGFIVALFVLVIITLSFEEKILQQEKDIAQQSFDSGQIGNENTNDNEESEKEEFVTTTNAQSDGKFEVSWASFLFRKANEVNINPYLVYELIKVETGGTFDPELEGPPTQYGKAKGLGQIMASNTAEWLSTMAGIPYEEEFLFDPYYSIELTVTYLDFLYERYGNWNETLTAYHRGMNGMEQYKEENGTAKSLYSTRILERMENHPTQLSF